MVDLHDGAKAGGQNVGLVRDRTRQGAHVRGEMGSRWRVAIDGVAR